MVATTYRNHVIPLLSVKRWVFHMVLLASMLVSADVRVEAAMVASYLTYVSID